MKKFLLIIFAAVTLTFSSCGIGTYSVVSGNADEAALCFVASEKYDITVNIDGTTYEVQTIKQKQYKDKRNIKKTVNEQISITPGRHSVKVMKDGVEVYQHEIFVSNTDVKVIEL